MSASMALLGADPSSSSAQEEEAEGGGGSYRKKYMYSLEGGGLQGGAGGQGQVELDLCYITERVIVMGSPFTSDECLDGVRSLFETQHAGHVKIFNLCDAAYTVEHDFDGVESFPFTPCNPCALTQIIKFCSAVQMHMDVNPQNVVVVTCKTGKGKSCMLVACYLLHSCLFRTAADVVSFLCRERTPHLFNALQTPSQIRYVHYYESLLRADALSCYTYKIDNIRMTGVPNFATSIVHSGCAPYMTISVLASDSSMTDDSAAKEFFPKRIYNQLDHTKKRKLLSYECSTAKHVDFPLMDKNVEVRGDVCVCLFSALTGTVAQKTTATTSAAASGPSGQSHNNSVELGEKMCQLHFNTCFVERNYLVFDQSCIDLAHRDAHHLTFPADFKVEVLLHRVEANDGLNQFEAPPPPPPPPAAPEQGGQEADLPPYWQHLYGGGDTVLEESDEEEGRGEGDLYYEEDLDDGITASLEEQ